MKDKTYFGSWPKKELIFKISKNNSTTVYAYWPIWYVFFGITCIYRPIFNFAVRKSNAPMKTVRIKTNLNEIVL